MRTMNFRKGALAVVLATGGILNMSVAQADWTYKFREHEHITVEGAFAAAGLSKLGAEVEAGTARNFRMVMGIVGGANKKDTAPIKEGAKAVITIYDKAVKYGLAPDKGLNYDITDMAEIAKIYAVKSTKPDAKTIKLSGEAYNPELNFIEKSLSAILDGIMKIPEFVGDVEDMAISVLSFAESLTIKQVAKKVPIVGKISPSDRAAAIKTGADLMTLFHVQKSETMEFYAYAINEIAYAQIEILGKILDVMESDMPENEKAEKIVGFVKMLDVLKGDLMTHRENLDNNYTARLTIDPLFRDQIVSIIDSNIDFATSVLRRCNGCVKIAVTKIISDVVDGIPGLDDGGRKDAVADFIRENEYRIGFSEFENWQEIEEYVRTWFREKSMVQQDWEQEQIAKRIADFEQAYADAGLEIPAGPRRIDTLENAFDDWMVPEHVWGILAGRDAKGKKQADVVKVVEKQQSKKRNDQTQTGKPPKTATKLPATGVSVYNVTQQLRDGNGKLISSSGDKGMTLYVNWQTGKVYGVETDTPILKKNYLGGALSEDMAGNAIFYGHVDREKKVVTGRYVASENILRFRSSYYKTTLDAWFGDQSPVSFRFSGAGDAVQFEGETRAAISFLKPDEFNQYGTGRTEGTLGVKGSLARQKTNPVFKEDVWNGFSAGYSNRPADHPDLRYPEGISPIYSSDADGVQLEFRYSYGQENVTIAMSTQPDGQAVAGNIDTRSWIDNAYYFNQSTFLHELNAGSAYIATSMDEDDNYDFMSWGVWRVVDTSRNSPRSLFGHWVAGKLTQDADVPRSGTARYEGKVAGIERRADAKGNISLHALNGASNLTADFGAGKVSGRLDIRYANNGAFYTTSELRPNVTITGNQFKGDLAGSNHTGTIRGAFYGPGASEIGGNWHISKGAQSQATGIFSGKDRTPFIP